MTARRRGQAPRCSGADASHAWVQVWCPDAASGDGRLPAGWTWTRPTTCVPGSGHVRAGGGARLRRRDAAARRHPRRRRQPHR
ncbi:MAG: hypothetical protein MZW92_56670 [Comamonadaceae bacterium]|nr:hypothetical protein [Comamonadaceae bacterium]